MCVIEDDYEPSESLLNGDFSCETTEWDERKEDVICAIHGIVDKILKKSMLK